VPVELGADPNAESASGFTPLDGAREGGHEDIAQLLRARGANRMRKPDGQQDDSIDEDVEASDHGQDEAAIDDESGRQRDRGSAGALVHEGDALRHRGRHQTAIRCYDRAIAIGPRYAGGMAWGNKGIALQELDRPDEALACYEEVLTINPRDATACFNIAVVHDDEGRRDEAIRWYRTALERKPDHRGAKANLAELLGDSDADTG
jgi:tetratricopeptide (TPR) repeat protein